MIMVAYDGSSRDRLRTATSGAHARVDACFPGGLGDTAAYRRYLCGMHGLVAALEDALATARLEGEWQRWCNPHRVTRLTDDLRDLGADVMPRGPALSITGAAEAVGAMYVVEGSALGATLLLRDAVALGWTADRGARFLHGHGGADAGKRWRAYVQGLEAARFDAHEEKRMFEAAARTFAYAEHEFLRATQRTD